MDTTKDYYAILGVLPTTEIEVIKAAYRALSKLYHPDVYKGSDAKAKMVDLNEAYGVLSDPSLRRQYDDARKGSDQSESEYFDEDTFTTDESSVDPLEHDWALAVEYYPDLEELVAKLAKLSSRLAYSYKAYLLETKEFERRSETANRIELQFLKQYFGDNKEIIAFAKTMVNAGRKDVLRDLNKAVKVLGKIDDASVVIARLKGKYSVRTYQENVGDPLKESYSFFQPYEGSEHLGPDLRLRLYREWKDGMYDSEELFQRRVSEAVQEAKLKSRAEARVALIAIVVGMSLLFLFIAASNL
jgi:curved DNA-binding protein CbpA